MKSTVKDVRGKALATIEKYEMLTEGMSVVIGFSGGPDSLCLFDLLVDLKDELNLRLYPVHINHNLRGEASDGDQAFCEAYASEHGLKCRVYSFDCEAAAGEEGISTEEAGRNFRYKAFIEVAKEARAENKGKDVAIAVAQNADDQAETVLMRIMRGTGTDGLAGIPYKRAAEGLAGFASSGADTDNINVVRPLLSVFRNEIEAYCDEKGLKPRIDHTNSESIYSRNKIRLELIPALSEYNPNIKEALIRLSSAAEEDRSFLEFASKLIYENSILDKNEDFISLDRGVLKDEHPAVRRRVLSLALKDAGLAEAVGSVHYEAIAEALLSENPSAHADLPNGYSAWRVYRELRLGKKPVDREDIMFGMGLGSFGVHELTMKELDSMEPAPNTYCAFDLDLMKKELGENALDLLELRRRRAGDEIKTEGGTKKIQDLLVDMKVPKDERDAVKLIAIGNQALWVIPSSSGIRPRYTSKWKITSETEKIAYIVLLV